MFLDPFPTYHLLRKYSPFRYLLATPQTVPALGEPLTAWAFLKFADVYSVLRDHESFSSDHQLVGSLIPRLTLVNDDPPRQTHLRRLVNKTFAPKRITALEPWLSSLTSSLLDAVGRGPVEFMSAYAVPLPLRTIASLLGIPGESYQRFKYWTDAVFSGPTLMNPEIRRQAIDEMKNYFRVLAQERRQRPGEDMITLLVESTPDSEALQESELIGFCLTLLIAGNETTTSLLGNMMGALARQPDLWRALREDRGLIDAAITESLRHESPFQRAFRCTTRDVEIAGVQIPKGSLVSAYLGGANRDPGVFSAPDEFRLDRSENNHLAFGAGIHYCLGAPLARVEARISLNALLDRFSTVTLGSLPAVRQGRSRGTLAYQSLPLVFS
jgi:cytochrome P450